MYPDYSVEPIEVEYQGCRFRNCLEARWAVFFDAIGISWEYMPEAFELPDGRLFQPEFLLHGITFDHWRFSEDNDLFVVVRRHVTEEDAAKIRAFSAPYERREDDWPHPELMNPVLVVGSIPLGDTVEEIGGSIFLEANARNPENGIRKFSFETVDGDACGAMFGFDLDNNIHLYALSSAHTRDYVDENDIDTDITEWAWSTARQIPVWYFDKTEGTICEN